MAKIRFVAKAIDDQEPLPGSGVEKGEKEILVGTLDIEDKSVIPILEVLKNEAAKGTRVEAWKKDDNGFWTLIAKRPVK